jgi:hypothetical protein
MSGYNKLATIEGLNNATKKDKTYQSIPISSSVVPNVTNDSLSWSVLARDIFH